MLQIGWTKDMNVCGNNLVPAGIKRSWIESSGLLFFFFGSGFSYGSFETKVTETSGVPKHRQSRLKKHVRGGAFLFCPPKNILTCVRAKLDAGKLFFQ